MTSSVQIEDATSSCSSSYKYLEIQSYDSLAQHDDTCCERTPLLGDKGRSKPLVTRSYSYERLRPRLNSKSSRPSISAASESSEKFSIWRLTREQKVTLMVTSTIDLVAFLSLSIMAPFFPEEALEKGVSDTLSGWIFGTSPFVTFLMSPFMGKLLPYTGLRFMFLSGIFLFTGCTILFGMLAFVPVDDGNAVFLTLAFLLQTIRAIGISASSTCSFVLCIQEFPDHVSTVFGFGELFVGLGLVVGPGIGGLLYGAGGFYLPFVVIGGMGIALLPIVAYNLPPDVQVPLTSAEDELPFRRIFCTPQALIISLVIIVGTYIWSILEPTLEPHLRPFSLSPEIVGVIFLVMASVYAVSSPVGGWLTDKVDDPRPIIITGFLFASLGCLLLGPSPLLGLDPSFYELWLVIISVVILGASASFTVVPTFDMLFSLAQEKGFSDGTRTYGMVAGFWMAIYSLGDFIGPSMGGLMSDTVGFEVMCTYSAALCLILALVVSLSWFFDRKCCKSCRGTTKTADILYDSFDSDPCLIVPA